MVSNNIVKYEGALGIKRIIVKGDSQLVVNFSNKSYTLKDEHMAAYLEEHQKMEKHFQGLELKHIPRGENVEADEIAKRASHRLATSLVLRGAPLQVVSFSAVNRARTFSCLATTTGAGASGLQATLRRLHTLGTDKAGRSGLDPRAQGLPHQRQAPRGGIGG
jgi:hypothetical protein